MVSASQFIDAAERIKNGYTVVYENGKSGEKSDGVYLCDCRGYVLWALRVLGTRASSIGTNWMIRNQMRTINRVEKAQDLIPGQLVFKSKTSKKGLNIRYCKGGYAYDERFGQIDVYHVGIVTQTSPSLIIRHCTKGGIKTDTKLGTWCWAGWFNLVQQDADRAQQDMQTGIITAKTGSTVNLRKQASKSSGIIMRMPIGSKVTILSSDDNWCMVKYGQSTGFVMSEFVDKGVM